MKTLINITFLAGLLFMLTGCELERYPSTAIASEEAYKTIDDATRLANGLYSAVRGRTSGLFINSFDVQGDMFNAAVGFGNRKGSPHKMDGSWGDSDYDVRDFWQNMYASMSQINSVLENIDRVEIKDSTEAAKLKRYKGEAYFFRAWIYHMLVKTYGEDYEPATAATNLGVPLVLVFDINAKPARATVAGVYQQIVSDIGNAESNLAAVSGVAGSPTVTIDAVRALKARVQLFMHDFAGAAATAQTLISGGKYPLISTEAALTTYWVNDNGTEDIFRLFASLTEYGSATEGSGSATVEQLTGGIYLGYTAASATYSPDFIPTQTLIDLYGTTDIRKAVYFKTLPVKLDGIDYSNIKLFAKFPGNPALYPAGSPTNYRHRVKVFRIAEMYLIRAEALAAAGNVGDAVITLNDLRTKRGVVAATAGNFDTELRNEWVREMVGEGNRIDCLKRWKMGFTGRVPQVADAITSNPSSSFAGITIPVNYYKLTWPIPRNEMSTNSNMVQNPRWLSGN